MIKSLQNSSYPLFRMVYRHFGLSKAFIVRVSLHHAVHNFKDYRLDAVSLTVMQHILQQKAHMTSNMVKYWAVFGCSPTHHGQSFILIYRHAFSGDQLRSQIVTDPQETAKTEYKHSTQITDKLTTKIYTQKLDLDYNPSDQLYTTHTKNRIRQEKNAKGKNSRDELLKELTPKSQQLVKGAMEKGAFSWLSALPIKAIGYALNKQEFTDAVCTRHGWKLKGTPPTVLVERQTLWITASYVN